MTRPPSGVGPLSGVSGPRERPVTNGVVHLGIGAFARAHPILYTELAAEAAASTAWGVQGVTGRRPDSADALERQNGLYGVLFRSAAKTTMRLVGSITEAVPIQNRARVIAMIADPATSVVTLTVTEKAYRADAPVMGILAEALSARLAAGGAPLTLVSCDNVPSNGATLREVLAAAWAPDAMAERWLEREIATPSSMVDRITPATTAVDHRTAAAMTGLRDDALVVAEPFGQWVIQDRFAADRPPWELAGVEFVRDVYVHEQAKLRLLNGTHTLLACAGAVGGHATIAEAVADPMLRLWCARWLREARATLPSDMQGQAYSDSILERFANPALRHQTRQIARDTSQKIGMRILSVARLRLAAGYLPTAAAFAVGAWVAFAWTEIHAGRELEDPLARALARAVLAAGRDLTHGAMGMLAEVGPEWPVEFSSAVANHAAGLVGLTGDDQ